MESEEGWISSARNAQRVVKENMRLAAKEGIRVACREKGCSRSADVQILCCLSFRMPVSPSHTQ